MCSVTCSVTRSVTCSVNCSRFGAATSCMCSVTCSRVGAAARCMCTAHASIRCTEAARCCAVSTQYHTHVFSSWKQQAAAPVAHSNCLAVHQCGTGLRRRGPSQRAAVTACAGTDHCCCMLQSDHCCCMLQRCTEWLQPTSVGLLCRPTSVKLQPSPECHGTMPDTISLSAITLYLRLPLSAALISTPHEPHILNPVQTLNPVAHAGRG
jgi:hypothetical protein